jgi:hypothetical protein
MPAAVALRYPRIIGLTFKVGGDYLQNALGFLFLFYYTGRSETESAIHALMLDT